MTKPITRAEFAAVSVKLYEKLSATIATPASINPFKDTNEQDVLRMTEKLDESDAGEIVEP